MIINICFIFLIGVVKCVPIIDDYVEIVDNEGVIQKCDTSDDCSCMFLYILVYLN